MQLANGKDGLSTCRPNIFPCLYFYHRTVPVTAKMRSIDVEDQLYDDEVKAVKQWWTNSRWRYTSRPFTAEQIVMKRGTSKSSTLALFKTKNCGRYLKRGITYDS